MPSAMRSEKETGLPPTFYTLLTNAVLFPATRDEIIRLIKGVLPNTNVISQGGGDICALLDLNPKVVRAFPQILGLRNLQDLLSERLNADILARSETAIKEAEDLVRVFVPTAAYYDALSKLGKYFFVILEGMPEMGKTTIGRIISLTKMNDGWSAIECRSSDDFLKSYRYEDKQVFFADDFFGRITYDPGRVSKWQDDLPHIFRRLDSNHWLIFTSRIHLLKIAKDSLDVSGLNDIFPKLSEVTVDAGSLTEREKALILYRHAKTADFSTQVKNVVRREASKIIGNTYFTPERIKRLVRQVLLHEIQPHVDTLSVGLIAQIIQTSLSSPTISMRRTFEAIAAAHRWLLFAMVEASSLGTPNLEDVRRRYEAICPEEDLQPFDLIIDELSEAFVNRSQSEAGTKLYWMHPSAMDMVVEAFAQDERLRRHYLSHCSAQGIALATSIGGGTRGAREVPLLLNEEDWRLCAERAKELLELGYAVLRILFDNYRAILIESRKDSSVQIPERYSRLLFDDVIGKIVDLAQAGQYEWTVLELEMFYSARALSQRYIPTVNPSQLFNEISKATKGALESSSFDPSDFDEFQQLAALLDQNDPTFLVKPNIKPIVSDLIDLYIKRGIDEAENDNYYFDNDDVEAIEREVGKLEELSAIYEGLSKLSFLRKEVSNELKQHADTFQNQAFQLADLAKEIRENTPDPSDYDYHDIGAAKSSERFSISDIFSDL